MLTSGALNLIMASLWLVAGVVILITDPPGWRLHVFGTGLSAGWAALLLAAYNGVRWWGLRSAFIRRRAAGELQRHRPARRAPGEPEAERNPDFIFDEPPQPPEKPG